MKEVLKVICEEPKELKRRELLDRCFELFVCKGLENTSLNELAAYCNMHKATFYSYLNSKDEIVVESAKQYMEKVDKMFFEIFENPQRTVKQALQHGFEIIARDKNKFKYIYQVISSPKYGEKSRRELTQVYMKYMDYSKELAQIYNVNHTEFRPYFLLYIATIHDFCLWENKDMVNEKLEFIYSKVGEFRQTKKRDED